MAVRQPLQTIIISAIGFKNTTTTVDLLHNDQFLDLVLDKKADATLDEVVVNSTKEISRVRSVEMNVVRINPELIKRSPLILGEADIIKALTLQPGITTAGEGAGGFNVRGGNADQNLVLVDGSPLFNTSHLLGFFTSVSPDEIQDVTLYKGGMPAQYGGRISSLLNMKVKSGGQDRMRYTTGLGPVSARFSLNGPLVKDKLTFAAGLRAAYPNIALNVLPGKFGDSRAVFFDAVAKAEYSFTANNKISLTGYKSYDKFRFDTATSYDWHSNLLSLNGTFLLTPKLSLKANANYSQFVSGINNLATTYEFKISSTIAQQQGKLSLVYLPDEMNKIEVGGDYILYNISPGEQRPTAAASIINTTIIQKEKGREIAAFINDEITFTNRIALQAGIRYATYNYLGPKAVYTYEAGLPLSKETISDTTRFGNNTNIQQYGGFEPRLSLKLGISDRATLKLSFNSGQQFLHLVSNTTAISPVDFWKLSDNYIKSQRGEQYSLGYFQNFTGNKFEVAVEGYYRTIKNTVDYKDGATLLMNDYIESALLAARGRGYGVEISLIKNSGKVTGQINYSYSKAETQVVNEFPSEQVNNGIYYPASTDRPHNLSVVSKIKLDGGWSFSANFVLTSGRPATFPDGNYEYNGTIVTDYSKRNLDRLPLYHRLDAGFTYVSRRYPEQRRYSIVNFSFYNLYAHQNAYSIYYQRSPIALLPYQLSVLGTVIPSLSWTYNF